MSTHIYATELENKADERRKRRKSVDLKSLQKKSRPTAWLRSLISPIDFGVKVRALGPRMEPVIKPVHCNTNDEIVGAFRDGEWNRIDRLSNRMLDEHWSEEATHYFVADGSKKSRFVLANVDIDCHAQGTRRGAVGAAEHLADAFFPGLYHEPSTHEEGRHGYFILDKGDLEASHVKAILKDLERALDDYLGAQGFDIELCEIKGLPPVVTWGDDGRISNYTAGVLAKIPRQVDRFDEWKRTTVLDQFQIRRLIAKLRSLTPQTAATEVVAVPTDGRPALTKVSGSIGGKLIGDEELAQLAEDGRYRRVAITLMETHVLKTSGRSVVTAEDVAAFFLLLKFFTNRMNADGTLPVKRFKGLWTGLYEAGDLARAFDCHRFKAIRDYLSDLGLIDWEDETYVVPRIDESGRKRKGRACKWKAGRLLMEMLDQSIWEESGKHEHGKVGSESEEIVGGIMGARGKAPFVGTDQSPISAPLRHDARVEAPGLASMTIPFIQTVLRPDPLRAAVQALTMVSDDRRVRPVEAAEVKPWRLSPDEVTRLIPDFEESFRLLAA